MKFNVICGCIFQIEENVVMIIEMRIIVGDFINMNQILCKFLEF